MISRVSNVKEKVMSTLLVKKADFSAPAVLGSGEIIDEYNLYKSLGEIWFNFLLPT